MKKLFLGIVLGISIAMTISFTSILDPTETTAEVNRIRGIAIFTDSKPVKDFEVIGTVKIPNMTMKDHVYYVCRDELVVKAKEKYPDAAGLMIYSDQGGQAWYTADVIKFKK